PLLLASAARRPFIMDYAENDEMRVAHPDRLAEIVAVQGIPAEAWIRDSVLPETAAATPTDRWQRAVAWMLQGEKGTSLQLLARLTDQPFSAVRWKTPQYRAAFRAWNLPDSAMTWYGPDVGSVAPRRDHPPYGGPITLLASSGTSGAAEDLLAAFRATGRG